MILARLANAVRRQDWFQVIVEVLIVIVGIFLALQVQAWYEGRQAKEVEQRFIEYLIADIENTLDFMTRMEGFYQDRIDRGKRALQLLKQDTLTEEDRSAFEIGINGLSQSNNLDSYLGTFLNGDLDLVLDPNMRRTIDNFIAVFNTSNQVMENNRASLRPSLNIITAKVALGSGEVDSELVYYDFDGLKNDPEFAIAVANSIDKINGFLNRTLRVQQYASALLPVLAAYRRGEDVDVLDFRAN